MKREGWLSFEDNESVEEKFTWRIDDSDIPTKLILSFEYLDLAI